MLQGFRLVPPALLHCLHDTGLETTNRALNGFPINGLPFQLQVQGCTSLRCHLPALLRRLAKFFRDGRPGGSLLAFAPGNVTARIQTITVWHSLAPPSSTRIAIERTLQRDYPDGSNTGLPCSACVTGLG
jgi:hypothetical protein